MRAMASVESDALMLAVEAVLCVGMWVLMLH